MRWALGISVAFLVLSLAANFVLLTAVVDTGHGWTDTTNHLRDVTRQRDAALETIELLGERYSEVELRERAALISARFEDEPFDKGPFFVASPLVYSFKDGGLERVCPDAVLSSEPCSDYMNAVEDAFYAASAGAEP